MSVIDCVKLPNNSTYNITLPLLSSGFTTTAGNSTSGSYLAAKWAVANVNGITTPVDGMTIAVRVPLAGNSGGVLLSIDGGTKYYPIVRNVNSLITTHYALGTTVILTFNSTQTAEPYTTSNTKETITGCWQVADYDSNTQSNTNSTDTSSKIFLVGATSQGSNKTTYSHREVYVGTDHHVYSNSKQTVNLSDTQALTNKTYNGYTLGAACAKGVDTVATSGSANLITSGAMYTALGGKASTSVATTSANGLMSSTDKSKLDGIATGANNYTLPVATSSAIGGVKSGTDITIDSSGNVSVNDDSHNHVISNIDSLQNTLDAKVPTTRTVNGKALSADITLSPADIGITISTSEPSGGSEGDIWIVVTDEGSGE